MLRLMENFRTEVVYEAVRDALRLGAISFDAIKHLVLCRMEGRPLRHREGSLRFPGRSTAEPCPAAHEGADALGGRRGKVGRGCLPVMLYAEVPIDHHILG